MVNAKRLIVALVAAVTLTLFMAAAGAQQLAAPLPAAEQDDDPADAFFDRIEGDEVEEEEKEEEEWEEEAEEEEREDEEEEEEREEAEEEGD